MTTVIAIAGVLLLCAIAAVVLLAVQFAASKPPPESRRHGRKPQLFNPDAEDLTLQSADNLRLFSDRQLKEVERQDDNDT